MKTRIYLSDTARMVALSDPRKALEIDAVSSILTHPGLSIRLKVACLKRLETLTQGLPVAGTLAVLAYMIANT